MGKYRTDFIDYPTGHALNAELSASEHRTPECSSVQTEKALLCDCGAIYELWHNEYGGDPERVRAADYDPYSPERKAKNDAAQ